MVSEAKLTKLYFTQIDPPAPAHVDALARKGWQAIHLPFRRLVYKKPPVNVAGFDAVIITSMFAARWLLDQRPDSLPPLAIVGGTSSSLFPAEQLLWAADPAPNARVLVDRMLTFFPTRSKFLYLVGANARDTVAKGLEAHQLVVSVVYETVKLSAKCPPLDPGAMVYFQAPSTVTDFMEHYPHSPDRIGAIGPSTAEAVRMSGWKVDFQPGRPETQCFIAEIPRPGNL